MNMNNENLSGVFFFGLIVGAALVFFFNHRKYQDKTVEEWYNQYQTSQTTYQTLTSCLNNMRAVSINDDPYNQYITNYYYKKSDVTYCLGY